MWSLYKRSLLLIWILCILVRRSSRLLPVKNENKNVKGNTGSYVEQSQGNAEMNELNRKFYLTKKLETQCEKQ